MPAVYPPFAGRVKIVNADLIRPNPAKSAKYFTN